MPSRVCKAGRVAAQCRPHRVPLCHFTAMPVPWLRASAHSVALPCCELRRGDTRKAAVSKREPGGISMGRALP